ncbi:beta-1,4-glucuronyltransferase 1 [Contarinia nasturtii]|uniref:beta-1,4-glucuronyltransferase 1 n=1 Tax=Contarinia nasturtii TaxID=265458 RepID=UPI0012D3CC53|nr:beta-1,4-glucuronyltransferase 1 [Contarinia nasturtii]XP_031617237.1 beta-1,4-glucuronyltransferase 1 [Contarinia nasturtii]XP_031617238.1 beta-1,4-glucuronyltransferase 1 [Contarinia nasturtii]
MFTRRNWLLRCSILINIAVLLYICSHLMIGNSNISLGPAFVIQDDYAVKSQQAAALTRSNAATSAQQQTGDNAHDKQEQQPQDAEPEPPIDNNDSNQMSDKDGQNEFDADPEQLASKQRSQLKLLPKEQQIVNVADDSQLPKVLQSDVSQSQPNKVITDVLYPEANFVNASDIQVNTEEHELETRLKLLIHCHDKEYEAQTVQRSDFWVLKNYIRADHGELRCFQTLTYTTHADYTFLDNLIPLLERWNAPVSIALHAPGTDFLPTINSIRYLRDCTPESSLVRQFTTFHIYFSSKHIPKAVPKHDKILEIPFNCSVLPPYANVSSSQLYKTQKKLLYPVNVGRNIARDAAMTHFILASDIELYPNPGLAKKFLEMVARNDAPLQRKNPRVFPLSLFEVDSASQVPRDKTELQELLKSGKAIPFHKRVCSSCHGVPKSKEWMAANETDDLGVFHIGKRTGYFVHWEPIYIGTHADPHYDERLSWEGKSDKMTQGYALCALDYEFHILDNAFLVHKPGIKVLKKDTKRAMLAAKTNQLIKKIIYPELQVMYGLRKGCAV